MAPKARLKTANGLGIEMYDKSFSISGEIGHQNVGGKDNFFYIVDTKGNLDRDGLLRMVNEILILGRVSFNSVQELRSLVGDKE